MSEEANPLSAFEWYDIPPGKQFFDQLERRYFANTTKRTLKVGFGHDTRRVEIIAIADGKGKDPKIAALEGIEVEEE